MRLPGLNEEQSLAVTATEGYVRVVAGAGSGKTRALTRRYAFLVGELGILPENILCVTFTNKAASEMRSRIRGLVRDDDTAYINTFHGFCVSVLREDIHFAQYPRSFLVLDNGDIDAMLRQIYDERGLTLRDMSFADARDMIEIQKLFKKPGYCADLIAMPLGELRRKYDEAGNTSDIIFYGYLWQEKKCFALDYNDLIKFVLHIFASSPELRLKWQKRLAYVMIDEFQDIDGLQYELMEALCGWHKNLFVVGDPDQTIYTWRGANVKYLLDFDKRFPGTRTVRMLRNYRSTPQIVAAVNSMIAANGHRIKKDLAAQRADGESVRFYCAPDAGAEAEWIAAEAARRRESGVPYRDIAVLYRAHYLSRAVEEALIGKKIPYRVYSGVQFYDRAEIKDALSWLRMISLRDDLSFRRVVNKPRRNMGKRRMEFLERVAAARGLTLFDALRATLDDDVFKGTRAATFVEMVESFAARARGAPVSEVLAAVLDESGYEAMLRTEGAQDRLDNLAELKQAVREYEISCGEEAGIDDFLAHAALLTAADADDAGDRVRLMTVHAAKGLEFPHVYLCGMNEGVFPSRKVKDRDGMEEERRLAFVAMTRARDSLTLTAAAGRNFDGSPRFPSRFALDIADGLVEYVVPPEPSLIADARETIAASERRLGGDTPPTLDEGTRVRHAYFGEGVILRADAQRRAYTVKFDAYATPRDIAYRTRLERL